MAGGSRVRWAVAASVGAHALLVAVCVVITRHTIEPPIAGPPAIETRVTLNAERLPEARAPAPVLVTPAPEPTPPEPPPPEPSTPPSAPDPPPAEPPSAPTPRVVEVPAVLPPGLLARVREFAATPTPVADPGVRPAGAATTAPHRPTAQPAHGALAAGQRVVYLLDGSGSMGEWGKFDAARNVIAATVTLQPPAVDVKVVVYTAAAEVVPPAALTARTPAGRGDHLAGVRAALAQAPDFVVWFTDSDDLPTAAVRNQVRRMGKPVTVVVARVGPSGVAAPVELR